MWTKKDTIQVLVSIIVSAVTAIIVNGLLNC